MPNVPVLVVLSVLLAMSPACGPRGAASTPPEIAGQIGNIDTRPFAVRSGFAHRRKNGDIDIHFYERALTEREVCYTGLAIAELAEAERAVWIQMPWPVVVGTEGQDYSTKEPNFWGIFFHVQRGHGSTSKRAIGTVKVERARPDGGTLFIDAATENDGDLHGSVRGSMSFVICPR